MTTYFFIFVLFWYNTWNIIDAERKSLFMSFHTLLSQRCDVSLEDFSENSIRAEPLWSLILLTFCHLHCFLLQLSNFGVIYLFVFGNRVSLTRVYYRKWHCKVHLNSNYVLSYNRNRKIFLKTTMYIYRVKCHIKSISQQLYCVFPKTEVKMHQLL